MFPEYALAGKPIDGRGDYPGIAVGSEESGTESIDDDNNGSWHTGASILGVMSGDGEQKVLVNEVIFSDCAVVCYGINAWKSII